MKKLGSEGGSQSCQIGEIATIIEAPIGHTGFGARLLARTITNTPPGEARIRGLA